MSIDFKDTGRTVTVVLYSQS